MSRKFGAITASVVGALTFAGGAVAATPINNGVYDDSVHGVIVALHGKNSIHAFNVVCRGKTWVATMFIPVKAGGKFSYKGPDFLAKHGHKTKTTGSMTASGTFKTSRVITGSASAGGCKVRFRATP